MFRPTDHHHPWRLRSIPAHSQPSGRRHLLLSGEAWSPDILLYRSVSSQPMTKMFSRFVSPTEMLWSPLRSLYSPSMFPWVARLGNFTRGFYWFYTSPLHSFPILISDLSGGMAGEPSGVMVWNFDAFSFLRGARRAVGHDQAAEAPGPGFQHGISRCLVCFFFGHLLLSILRFQRWFSQGYGSSYFLMH